MKLMEINLEIDVRRRPSGCTNQPDGGKMEARDHDDDDFGCNAIMWL